MVLEIYLRKWFGERKMCHKLGFRKLSSLRKASVIFSAESLNQLHSCTREVEITMVPSTVLGERRTPEEQDWL